MASWHPLVWTLTALGRDGTRVPDTTRQGKIRVLPLANPGWTLGSAHTLDGRRATYPRTNTPGAVTVSVQIVATTFPVDCRPLVLLSSDLISAKRPWPLLSCCFGGLYCDWFAATWWNWWRIRTLKMNNSPPLLPPPLSLQSAPWEQWKTLSEQRLM